MTDNIGKIVLLQTRDSLESSEREVRAVLNTTCLAPDRLRAVNILRGDHTVTPLVGAAALIIGGSGYSVFEDMPKLDELVEVVVEARERGVPMFGICFGIQLIAHAFGGHVVRDYGNRERGTFDIELTDKGKLDPLFCSLPMRFPTQQSHQDKVVLLPEDARLLASSERCAVQAFAMPGRIYGVQFHPERTKEEMEAIFTHRTHEMANTVDVVSPGGVPFRESPHASSILRRFVETL